MPTLPPSARELDQALADAIHALSAVETPQAFDARDIATLRRSLPASRAALARLRDDLRDRHSDQRGTPPLRADRLYTDTQQVVCGHPACAGPTAVITGRAHHGDPYTPLRGDDDPARTSISCRCGALTSATTGPLAGLALATR